MVDNVNNTYAPEPVGIFDPLVREYNRIVKVITSTTSAVMRCLMYYLVVLFIALVYELVMFVGTAPAMVVMVSKRGFDQISQLVIGTITYPVKFLIGQMVDLVETKPPPVPWYVDWYDGFVGFVPRIDITWTLTAIYIAGFLSVLLCCRLIRRSFRQVVMRTRGVYIGEALRNGSEFAPGKMPPGQVSIKVPGYLSDSHVGYGLRVGNVLVTPAHVIGSLMTPIIEYNGRKVLISLNNRIMSRLMPDIVYIMLDDVTWTRIGCPKVRLLDTTPKMATSVTCTGLNGTSVGLLRKSTKMGLMVYGGSTVPGMSGAGYFINDHVHGIHNGVMGNENVGVAISAILRELKAVFRGETPVYVEEEYEKQPKYARKLKTWDDVVIDQTVADVWGDLDDVEDEEYWNAKAGKFAGENLPQLVQKQNVVRLVGQNPEQPEVVYKTTVVASGFEELQARLANLENVIKSMKITSCADCQGAYVTETLSQHVEKDHVSDVKTPSVESPKHQGLSKERFPCERCGVLCKTVKSLTNHQETCRPNNKPVKKPVAEVKKNSDIVGESAYPMDFRKAVKTTPFLEERSRPPKTSGPKWKNTSPRRVSNKNSPSQEEILSQILKSQLSMQKSFEKLLPALAGQPSVTMRK